jgi:hypothetical protein
MQTYQVLLDCAVATCEVFGNGGLEECLPDFDEGKVGEYWMDLLKT